ncbi:amino acid permease 5 [Actinidia rufa]|uniref:Amino acid permease 5 n=1 Tax=Actinidia rufa TaxID=165716 RepID=A0A7J0EU60_9ERIC|nr:amino acid permease 5 [Actinidia rufa]
MQRNLSFSLENGSPSEKFDDDGRALRTGTVMTASAHIITAVIRSGVLSLAWAMAQFEVNCWHPITGRRNHTYMDVVRANLEIILSQIPNFHELSTPSIIAAVTSFTYPSIGLGLAIAKLAAFGNAAPGNFLTGFGFYEPFWLVDFANLCIVVHLVGSLSGKTSNPVCPV